MRSPLALVLGLGRFGGGSAAARYLARTGHRVRVADRAPADSLRPSVTALADVPRLELCLGREDENLLNGVDLVVCNPAIPAGHPLVARARSLGIRITQEVNLFLEAYPGQVVAVTGTNGKSSTATLLAVVLRSAGVDTLLGGNIGHSLLEDVEHWRADQAAVLEISSFQLERVDPARHRVAGTVLTRVTADHLDRHGTLAAYHGAKARAALLAEHFVAFDATDTVARTMARRDGVAALPYGALGTVRVVGTAPDLAVHSDAPPDPGPVVHAAAMTMPGTFQLTNAAGAVTAATALVAGCFGATHRVPRDAAGAAIASTAPLPRRLQICATIAGVRIFDNSVSTQVESTLSAMASLTGRVHWVGGGKSKDGRFAEPGRELRTRICTAHLFGSAAAHLAPVLVERVRTTVHEDLEDALDAAWTESRPGDTILFSPGFSSFDQFPNFAARAARFDAWVAGRTSTSTAPPSADGMDSPGSGS